MVTLKKLQLWIQSWMSKSKAKQVLLVLVDFLPLMHKLEVNIKGSCKLNNHYTFTTYLILPMSLIIQYIPHWNNIITMKFCKAQMFLRPIAFYFLILTNSNTYFITSYMHDICVCTCAMYWSLWCLFQAYPKVYIFIYWCLLCTSCTCTV